jgi:hypothetical protein
LLNYDVSKLYVAVMVQFHALLILVVDGDEYSAESSDRIIRKIIVGIISGYDGIRASIKRRDDYIGT